MSQEVDSQRHRNQVRSSCSKTCISLVRLSSHNYVVKFPPLTQPICGVIASPLFTAFVAVTKAQMRRSWETVIFPEVSVRDRRRKDVC